MFNNYKEIVTKAIIGKGKKEFKTEYEVEVDKDVDTVLGCWVINHNLKGVKEKNHIKINGSFDINIWHSYDNNTKTSVINKKVFYEEVVVMKSKEDDENTDIIIRSLKNPTCIDVSSDKNKIKYTISKELAIEIVGDQKIRIPISNNEDEYDIIFDEEDIKKEIDSSVREDYLDKEEEKN